MCLDAAGRGIIKLASVRHAIPLATLHASPGHRKPRAEAGVMNAPHGFYLLFIELKCVFWRVSWAREAGCGDTAGWKTSSVTPDEWTIAPHGTGVTPSAMGR
ncbi:hypothetical protein SRHO_G00224250 [Serrasalmus rhombeus]